MPHEKDQSATFSFKRIETVFLVLLLVTTFCSTFCAYEANNWNSISSTKNREGTDLRTQSVRAYNDGNTRLLVDISAFTTWIDAMSLNDTRKADAVRERFTPEMKVAFSAWAAQVQGQPKGTIPPGTPFTLPEYHLRPWEQGALLEENATVLFNEGHTASDIGSSYILNTLLYALVLFLIGVGERWKTAKFRWVILATALLLFAYATGMLLLLPKTF
ncbi:MAG: hypothetical protein LUO91_04080 [Methanomicrobiales archaeon]|nr:hypothetical protein [Methanomicrobiales archaeon]